MLSIHATLSALTHTPEFGLTEPEAEGLATALASVSKHYPMPTIAPMVMDHVNLAIVAFAVYAPRFAALKLRTASEAARNITPEPGVVRFG